MRVLLVQSWLGGFEAPVFPLGLACLAPHLRTEGPGHEVRTFDPNLSPVTTLGDISGVLAELSTHLAEFDPDVVGLSLRNIDSTNKRVVIFYYEFFRRMAEHVKAHSRAALVVGGSGFSMFAEEIMADAPWIDVGVYLEGEATFPAVLENLASPGAVPSVFHRQDGQVRFSGAGARREMVEALSPDWDTFPLERYARIRDAVGVETKRGCAQNCIYCPYGFLNGRACRPKDPIKVVDELEALASRGLTRFSFTDSIFNLPQPHAAAICQEMVRRKLKLGWSAWFSEREMTRDFARLVVEAGCTNIIFSPDALRDAVLKNLGKHITRADIERAFELLQGMDGFELSYNFFKNPPGQSLGAFLDVVRFCVKARKRMGRRVHFEFNSLRVEPHTKLHAIALEQGIVAQGQSLLQPQYYTNPGTAWIERAMNLLLRLKGK